MDRVAANRHSSKSPDVRDSKAIVVWLRDLSECRAGGLVSDEDFAIQRAEKLSEILSAHHGLWVAPLLAAGSLGTIAGSIAWAATRDVQMTGLAAALAALFGLAMLTRPFRESIKQAQIRNRLALLNTLLAKDLITAEEFLAFEERLNQGGSEIEMVSLP